AVAVAGNRFNARADDEQVRADFVRIAAEHVVGVFVRALDRGDQVECPCLNGLRLHCQGLAGKTGAGEQYSVGESVLFHWKLLWSSDPKNRVFRHTTTADAARFPHCLLRYRLKTASTTRPIRRRLLCHSPSVNNPCSAHASVAMPDCVAAIIRDFPCNTI